MRVRNALIITLLSAAVTLFGFSSAGGGTLSPCPPTDVEIDGSGIYGPGSWIRMEKGTVSDYFENDLEYLELMHKDNGMPFDPNACPYGDGAFYGIKIDMGTFDGENPIWRKVDPVK